MKRKKTQSTPAGGKPPFRLEALSKQDPATIYNRLKVQNPGKFLKRGEKELARSMARRFDAERKHRAERERRLGPVYKELRAAVRKTPGLSGVLKAMDAIKPQPRPGRLTPPQPQPFAPKKPLVRTGSIHMVFPLPLIPSLPWVSQTGTSNQMGGPAVNGATGQLSFEMAPGLHSSGQMACGVALGAAFNVPNQPCFIEFTATPSVSWLYSELSYWWRQAAGNLFIGQQVQVFDQAGTLLNIPIDTQVSLASFDDRNFLDSSNQFGSNSAYRLESAFLVGDFPFGLGEAEGDVGAQGAVILYWFYIGGTANADGSNGQSSSDIRLNAICNNLVVDIFEF